MIKKLEYKMHPAQKEFMERRDKLEFYSGGLPNKSNNVWKILMETYRKARENKEDETLS